MGVLAIDPGTRKTGFAYVDRLRIATVPLEAVRTDGDDEALLDHIGTQLAERDVELLLIGVPLDPNGEDTERSLAVRALITRMNARFPGLETVTYDEHGTTKEAESRLREAGYSGREARTRKDSWAALVLLEDWLGAGEPRARS